MESITPASPGCIAEGSGWSEAACSGKLVAVVRESQMDVHEKMPLPSGWDEHRIRDVLGHYESQTEDEQAAEIEEALEADGVTMMAVPDELADEVRALIARKRSA
jgi:hypothetical protein